jgi:hypothetical protein
VVVLSVVVSGAILLWFNRLPHPKSPEEELQEVIQRKAHDKAREWLGAGSE